MAAGTRAVMAAVGEEAVVMAEATATMAARSTFAPVPAAGGMPTAVAFAGGDLNRSSSRQARS